MPTGWSTALAILLFGLVVEVDSQSLPVLTVARTVTVAPFDTNQMQFVPCGRILKFVPLLGSGHRDLRSLFVGCSAHDVPVGVYRVVAEPKNPAWGVVYRQAQGVCEILQERPICTPDITDAVGEVGTSPVSTIRFELDGYSGKGESLWLGLDSVFGARDKGGSLLGKGSFVVAFDERGEAEAAFHTAATDYTVTLIGSGRAIASALLHVKPGETAGYRLTYKEATITLSKQER